MNLHKLLVVGLLVSSVALPAQAGSFSSWFFNLVSGSEESVGTFEDGKALGQRNGKLTVERVARRTVELEGCQGLESFQNAVRLISAQVQPPQGERGRSSKFTAGFFEGYMEALKQAVHSARGRCEALEFEDGLFVGELFGNIFCQAAATDPEALDQVWFEPLYAGWTSNDSDDACSSCVEAFSVTVSRCGAVGFNPEVLLAAQLSACRSL